MKNYEMKTLLPAVQWKNGMAAATLYIRLRDGRLSVTGDIREEGQGITHSGQCIDTIAELYPDNGLVMDVVQLWKRWHLNDMRAGCEHQRAEKWEEIPVDPSRSNNEYLVIRGYTGWNRMIWKPVEQGGLLNKPCPTCGYKYGSRWLFEALPQDVLDTLEKWRNDTVRFTVVEMPAHV
jgi:hypothetical protein